MDTNTLSDLICKYGALGWREAFGQVIVELGKVDTRIVVVVADSLNSVMADTFAKENPERSFNVGVAEQNMMTVAAGLALTGKIPIVANFGFLLTMRSCEQLRTSIAYPNLNVKIVSTHSGTSSGPNGPTHFSIEDIGILRSIPNMSIVIPADGVETIQALLAAYEHNGPVFIRIGRGDEHVPVCQEPPDFELGRAITLREGTDLTIVSNGVVLAGCLEAAQILEEKGISCTVLNMHTVKPLDRDAIVRAASKTKGIVTVEDHSIIGGLGTAIAEVIAEKNLRIRFVRKGFNDIFPSIGTAEEILSMYGLDAHGIAQAAKELFDQIKSNPF